MNAETMTVIGTGLAVVGFVYGFLRNFRDDVNKHLDKIEEEQKISRVRTDHLYQILINLVKDQKREKES